MIVPFMIDVATNVKAERLDEFYEFIKMQSKQEYGAIIVHEEYCMPVAHFRSLGRVETTCCPILVSDEPIRDEEYYSVHLYPLPDAVFEGALKQQGSKENLSLYLVQNRYDVFEEWLDKTLEQIERNSNEKIEALLLYNQYISVKEVAERRNIKIIYYEVGAFRADVYRPVVYFDFSGCLQKTALKERCAQFVKEIELDKNKILSGKEILLLMLKDNYLSLFSLYDNKPNFKCGVAMQGEQLRSLLPNPKSTNENNIKMAVDTFGIEDVLVRGVPKNALGNNVVSISRVIDKSRFASQFITNCDCVISRMSNMAYETMLWGRKSLSTEDGLYGFAGITTLNDKQNCEGNAFLSFVAFGFYIPREWLYDSEYLRWRLTMPSETEIYLKHLEYAFKKHDVALDDFLQCDKQRGDFLFQIRNLPSHGELMSHLEALAETNALYGQVKEMLLSLCKIDTAREFDALHNALNELLHQNYVISERDKELAHLNADIKETLHICGNLELKKTSLEAYLADIKDVNVNLQHEHAELQHEHTELQHEHTELQKDYSALQDSRENLQQSHDALAQQFNSLTREHNQLTQYLKTNKMKAIIKLLLNRNII